MSWLRLLLATLACLALTQGATAQIAKVQALYLFQFAKNIGWPEADADKDFVVVVVGDDEVAAELTSIAANKKVGNRKVEVVRTNSLQNATTANILFVSSSKRSLLPSAASMAYKQKMLLVSGNDGECPNGASISFAKAAGGKLSFEISERNIKRSGLSVAPKLLNLGKAVD